MPRVPQRTHGAAPCDSSLTMSSLKIFCSVAMPASNFCVDGGADGFERARGRREAARHGGHAGLRELQKRFRLRMFAGQIAHAPDRLAFLDQLAAANSRAATSSDSLANHIEQRGAIECGRGHRRARDDHVDRALRGPRGAENAACRRRRG